MLARLAAYYSEATGLPMKDLDSLFEYPSLMYQLQESFLLQLRHETERRAYQRELYERTCEMLQVNNYGLSLMAYLSDQGKKQQIKKMLGGKFILQAIKSPSQKVIAPTKQGDATLFAILGKHG